MRSYFKCYYDPSRRLISPYPLDDGPPDTLQFLCAMERQKKLLAMASLSQIVLKPELPDFYYSAHSNDDGSELGWFVSPQTMVSQFYARTDWPRHPGN